MKEHQRDARSFRWIDNSWLDLKLGARILIKYPGLTLVGGLGIAVGIAIAAGAFSIIYTLTDDSLPLSEGDRIVAIQNWDAMAKTPERRILHDVVEWRDQLTSVEDVGAFRQVPRNLIAPVGATELVRVAEMSASGFTVARVPPLMGRHLLEDDEKEGAPAVLVIGYDVWRSRFLGDPAIVGRPVQLGDVSYSVVGVMPEGFAFPVNNAFWVPLRLDPSGYELHRGPSISAFGRLAPGATLESAQTELTTVGQRMAAAFPKTHEQLRPTILPYTYPFFDLNEPATAWMAHLMQFLITLLLVVVCVNVAILVYARTATRQGEIAVRSALGASRARIVGQLFVEALVLAMVAAVVGLVMTSTGLRQVQAAMEHMYPQLPFWWTFGLSAGTVAYTMGLAVLAAAIVGVVPALKATGRTVQSALQGVSAGGGSGMQLGRTWTILIVVQVAIAVALLPAATFHAWSSIQHGTANPGFAAEEFLTAQLLLDRGARPTVGAGVSEREFATRYEDRRAELARRLNAEPAIAVVTFAVSLPGEEPTVWIEAEGVAAPAASESESSGFAVRTGSKAGHEVRSGRVAVGLFEAVDVPILTGRSLDSRDVGAAANAIVVNRSFAQKIFGGGGALGRRVRYVGTSRDADPDSTELGRWYEVVGVVSDFPSTEMESGVSPARMYHAAAPEDLYGAILAVRLRGTTPAAYAGRLREITAAVDPNLQLRDVAGMEEVLRRGQAMMRIVASVLAILTVSVILLSSAGIYALMSFAVSQRRKEIGIRTALGADPRRILGSIFSRALAQLAAGALLGGTVAALLEATSDGGLMNGNGPIVLPLVALLMMGIGLLAALGPARRGLRIHPTEVLREQ